MTMLQHHLGLVGGGSGSQHGLRRCSLDSDDDDGIGGEGINDDDGNFAGLDGARRLGGGESLRRQGLAVRGGRSLEGS